MIRLAVAFLIIVALAVGGVWLAENPGSVELRWGNWLLSTSIPVIAVALFVCVGLLFGFYKLLSWVLSGPGRLKSLLSGNREEKGYRALTEGMAAIASGDWRQANRAADRAERFLEGPSMARLLKAQAAQLSGDDTAAEKHFRTMLDSPETELVALRGLLIQAGQRGDHDKALEYARRAYKLKPEAGWVQRALFDLQTSTHDWQGALQTLLSSKDSGVYDKAQVAELRATLETAIAGDEEQQGRPKQALSHLEQALKQDPDHVPAIIAEARLQHALGRDRRAAKHLTVAWTRLHHPEIAQVLTEQHLGATPEERLKQAESMTKAHTDEAETQLLLGRLALEAGNAALARDYAMAAIDRVELADQRYCRLMSDACEALGENAEEAREWLSRAADAAPAPRWQCDDCQNVAPAWTPLCPSCAAFDGLRWRHAALASEPMLIEATEVTHADDKAAAPQQA